MDELREQIRGYELWIMDLLLEEELDMEEIDRLVERVRVLRAELKRREDEILDWARARVGARD
mgnify:CR=1 FL=1